MGISNVSGVASKSHRSESRGTCERSDIPILSANVSITTSSSALSSSLPELDTDKACISVLRVSFFISETDTCEGKTLSSGCVGDRPAVAGTGV